MCERERKNQIECVKKLLKENRQNLTMKSKQQTVIQKETKTDQERRNNKKITKKREQRQAYNRRLERN